MKYEIQIFARDKTKIIRFSDQESPESNFNQQMAWEDYYYAMGAVIDDKADKFRENNTVIGRLEVKDIPFDDVVDIMCEDLSSDLTRILTSEKEISDYKPPVLMVS